jgi:hypothetical protein
VACTVSFVVMSHRRRQSCYATGQHSDEAGTCAERQLDAAGVAYRWRDAAVDRPSKDMLRATGLRAIPVTATGDGHVLIEPTNTQRGTW